MRKSCKPDPMRLGARRICLHVAAYLASYLLVTVGSCAAGSNRNDQASATEVRAAPITHFSRTLPGKTQFGRLEFVGGMTLSSPDKNFGGWSGLIIDRTGHHLIAVSDAGHWLSANIEYVQSRPTALSNARIGRLRSTGGSALSRLRDIDAESIRLLSGTTVNGKALIAFERNQRIGVFPLGPDGPAAPAQYLKRPAEASRMRANRGFEALATVPRGRFKGRVIAFAEHLMLKPDQHTGWIWANGLSQSPSRITLEDRNGFDVTDAVPLADGHLIILERRFRWTEGVQMQLREIDGNDIRPGVTLIGNILLTADMTYNIDNMEAIAAHISPSGKTILTLMSDDNFNKTLQRTILLQFALRGQNKQASRQP